MPAALMANKPSSRLLREHTLGWALLASLVLHALLTLLANPFQLAIPKPPEPMEVVLLPPEPEPPAVAPPEPPPPEPPPPAPPPKTPPPPKPAPKLVTPEPAPLKEPPPAAPPPPVELPPAPPPVMTAPPVEKVAPVVTVPPPPPPPPSPSPQEIDAAKYNYSSLLQQAFARHKQYPRVAQMRGWQGTVKVLLNISASGAVLSSQVSESSGYEILDRQALEMVKKALPLPQPPAALRGEAFTILVPVAFRLE